MLRAARLAYAHAQKMSVHIRVCVVYRAYVGSVICLHPEPALRVLHFSALHNIISTHIHACLPDSVCVSLSECMSLFAC